MAHAEEPRRRDRKTVNYLTGANRLVRDFAAGVSSQEFRNIFERDASDAYRALARTSDQQQVEEPKEPVKRFLHRARIILLGLSQRLTPARRALFVLCLVLALFGALDWGFFYSSRGVHFDASPLWFLFSTFGLVLLLALELVDQIRVRDELEIAKQLQLDLLPEKAPDISGLSVAHRYSPAHEVGGDYYDFIPLAEDRVALVVADASGHGIAAGLLMAITSASLRMAIDVDDRPDQVALPPQPNAA